MMPRVTTANSRTKASDSLEKRPKCRCRHSSIQAAAPVNPRPNNAHNAMSRWALIMALEISGIGGWVKAHIAAVR